MRFLSRFLKRNAVPPEASAGVTHVSPTPAMMPPEAPGKKPRVEAPIERRTATDEIALDLGDFLHRIPAQLLHPGPHDLKKQVTFKAHYLSDRIASGETSIPLSEIYVRVPSIFRCEIREVENVDIRFPWQKIARLLAPRDGAPDESAERNSEAIGAKLRAAMPGRKAPSEPTLPGPPLAAPVLPGWGRNSAAWFSRPTIDLGMHHSMDNSVPPVQTTSHAGSTTAAHLAHPGSTNQPTPKGPHTSESAAEDGSPNQNSGMKSAGDSPRKSDDFDLSGLPVDSQRVVLSLKAQFERQIGELERVRRQQSDEIERHRAELDAINKLLGEEKTVTEVNRDLLQKALADRDEARKEMAALQKRADEIESQSKLAELLAERNALLQQKAHLSAQVAELGKRGATPSKADPGAGGLGGQRQVEDLQRRIVVMEAAQRESALELAREKEARSKAEKMLAAADKLQEQSANYMETAKGEMRKEIELSVKAREIEYRKAQKELQDQVSALSEKARLASAELENAHKRISELQSAAESPERTGPPSDIQQALIAQLESDIETYRSRIKAVIAERDAAKESLQPPTAPVQSAVMPRDLDAGRSGPDDNDTLHAARITELEHEINTLRARLTEAESAQRDLKEHAASMEALRDQAATLEQALTQAVVDRERAVALVESGQRRLSELEAELKAAKLDADGLRSAAWNASDLKSELERGRAECNTLSDELTKVKTRSAAIATELDQLRIERDALSVELSQARGQLEALSAAHDAQCAAHAEALDLFRREAAAQLAALQGDLAHRDARIASLSAEFESVQNAFVQVSGELAALREDLRLERRSHSDAISALEDQKRSYEELRNDAEASITGAHHALTAEREARTAEKSASSEDLRILSTRVESLTEELNAVRNRGADELASLRAELAKTTDHRDELLRRISRLGDGHHRMFADAHTDDSITHLKTVHAAQEDLAEYIDVITPEMIHSEPANNVSIPLVRPVPIPPPRVNRG